MRYRYTPVWHWALIALFFVLGIAQLAYTWNECGWRTLLLGNGGFWAAQMGLCEGK
jgi:hypothetical protein